MRILYELAEKKAEKSKYRKLIYTAFTLSLLAILFQVGHFFEHILQAGAWIIGIREKPYMTEFGMWLVSTLGQNFFPSEPVMRQNVLGMELLHFIGNTIFFLGIATMFYFLRAWSMFIALFIQTFHFYEHICLVFSQINTGKAVGLSTLYGTQLDQYAMTAYRVWWHFAFNAIPTTLVILSLYCYVRRQKKNQTSEHLSF